MYSNIIAQSKNILQAGAEFHGFCISDKGIGIEDQCRKKVFDIFTGLQSRQHYSGSGIGLAICKKIMDRLGVEINEWGSTDLVFTLPAQ